MVNEGHHPSTANITLELYRLLSIFLSSRGFAELRQGEGEYWEPISHIQECEEDEITRLLLAIAITARVIDDREHKIVDLLSRECGTIFEFGKDKPLTLREACNKIIHAQKIRFDISETDAGQAFLNPIIYLYGKREKGVEWKATLDVIVFGKEYISCVHQF